MSICWSANRNRRQTLARPLFGRMRVFQFAIVICVPTLLRASRQIQSHYSQQHAHVRHRQLAIWLGSRRGDTRHAHFSAQTEQRRWSRWSHSGSTTFPGVQSAQFHADAKDGGGRASVRSHAMKTSMYMLNKCLHSRHSCIGAHVWRALQERKKARPSSRGFDRIGASFRDAKPFRGPVERVKPVRDIDG